MRGSRKYLVSLEITSPQLMQQVIARPHTKSHDGQGGILARRRGKAGAVHDKEIPNIVSLLELVQDGFLRISSHARDPDLVNGPSRTRCLELHFDVPTADSLNHFSG